MNKFIAKTKLLFCDNSISCWLLLIRSLPGLSSSPPSPCFRGRHHGHHRLAVALAQVTRCLLGRRSRGGYVTHAHSSLHPSDHRRLANEHDKEEDAAQEVVAAGHAEDGWREAGLAGDRLDHRHPVVQVVPVHKVLDALTQPGQPEDHKKLPVDNLEVDSLITNLLWISYHLLSSVFVEAQFFQTRGILPRAMFASLPVSLS